MNAPIRAEAEPLLEDFPYRLSDNVRFADLDINQHVNNASYASYFETSRVTLMKDAANGLQPDGFGWVMVRLDINFRAELHWPGTIDLGLGVAKSGRTTGFTTAAIASINTSVKVQYQKNCGSGKKDHPP